ncbi:MAG: TonB family protein [Geobacter sp.]|nr:TonB family protein [Geobacter sp.]
MSLGSEEKSLNITLTISFLLHVLFLLLLVYLPPAEQKKETEPIMVDLEDLPQLKEQLPRGDEKAKRQAETRQRVPVESAPRGDQLRNRITPPPVAPRQPQAVPSPRIAEPSRQKPAKSEMPGDSLFRAKKEDLPDLAKLLPSANRLERLEENYRRKYEDEVKENDTKFLNTDDILFGSFLRRFETAVYNVWRYPPDAARLGIEGVVPVRITFNRKGEIQKAVVLESSGSIILDDEVRRALRQIGPIGALPKGYGKDEFHLIAFFHYGIVSGSSRGRLY